MLISKKKVYFAYKLFQNTKSNNAEEKSHGFLSSQQISVANQFKKLSVFNGVPIASFSVEKTKGLIFCISKEGGELRVYRCKTKPFLVHKISLGSITKLWKKVFSSQVLHTFVVTTDIILIMMDDFRFRLMDLGSIIDKNYKLFSSYDYATFEFKPALEEDFFYKWNNRNPFHKDYDRQLAEVYYHLEDRITKERDNKEYDSLQEDDLEKHATNTILEESEPDSLESKETQMQKSEEDLFCKPRILTKIVMDPHDSIEIDLVYIWILHLDGFQYEIKYSRRKKEFLLKDDRVNWINEYFHEKQRKQKLRRKVKKKVKLGELLCKVDLQKRNGEISIDGSIPSGSKQDDYGKKVFNIIDNQSDSINRDKLEKGQSIKESLKRSSEKQIEVPSRLSVSKQYQSEKVATPKSEIHDQNLPKQPNQKMDDILLYDSSTPSEVIYKNISDLTMNQKDFLQKKSVNVPPRQTNDLLKSEVNHCDAVQRFFKKDHVLPKQIDEQNEENWSNKAFKHQQQPSSKLDLMNQMRQSLKSAEEYSKQSIFAESLREDSQDLLSEFSRESDKNTHAQLSLKRKTTFNGLQRSGVRYLLLGSTWRVETAEIVETRKEKD